MCLWYWMAIREKTLKFCFLIWRVKFAEITISLTKSIIRILRVFVFFLSVAFIKEMKEMWKLKQFSQVSQYCVWIWLHSKQVDYVLNFIFSCMLFMLRALVPLQSRFFYTDLHSENKFQIHSPLKQVTAWSTPVQVTRYVILAHLFIFPYWEADFKINLHITCTTWLWFLLLYGVRVRVRVRVRVTDRG